MCGIIGIINKFEYGFCASQTDLFTKMLYCNAVRGFDSTGIFAVNKIGNLDWMKSKFNPTALIGTKLFQETLKNSIKDGQVLIGHNRKATTGVISDQNAHPFTEKHITLVHNGTIFNHKEHADTEVDSHAITKLIAKQGYKDALKEIDGAFTLIWYDIKERKLYCIRNDKRPMYILETFNSWVLSSEEELASWLIDRDTFGNTATAIKSTVECKPGVCYSWDIKECKSYSEETLELYKPKTFFQQTTIFPQSQWQNPNIKKKPQTTTGTTTTHYTVGDTITFRMVDYFDTPSPHWAGIIEGHIDHEDFFKVRAFFKNENWIEFVDEGYLTGKISSINTTEPIGTLWVTPESMSPVYTLVSFNGVEIKHDIWALLPHNCQKCKDEITFHDIPQSIIKIKNTRKTILCPECVDKVLEKQVKYRQHPQHAH